MCNPTISGFAVLNKILINPMRIRPIRNLSPKALLRPPFSSSSNQSTLERSQQPVHDQFETDPSRWSSSQFSELRPGFISEDTCDDGDSVNAESARLGLPHHRHRPHSFSTISEHQSVTNTTAPGEFRIVIDRSDDRPKSADGSSNPALEVPIPHYRLGTPQFNAEGSAAIHSSIYTRTSFSDNPRASSFLRDNRDIPQPNIYTRGSLEPGRPSFAASMFSGAAAIDLSKGSAATENSIVYELKEPVEPAIFETLGSDMDCQSVVRYIPGTKHISAATPARIVAEISSESFMDYELVSDFFLTFRSYLSTNNLLDLLLARLQWAINRLQDDGRIIRIRTFAALRHWILNYFVDDFVANYDLRHRFCETINSLFDDVKAREGGGMSDLKILIDLKRCWQGKCSLYWTSMDLVSAYHSPHTAIHPGGVSVECPDYNGKHSQNFAQVGFPPSARQDVPVANIGQHDRNDSAATAKTAPVSPPSDQSAQNTSCSLPLLLKSAKHKSMPFPYPNAPRRVSLKPTNPETPPQDRKPVSPIITKHHQIHSHAHKRSGSFSDSVRDDRAPIFSSPDQQGNFPPQEMLDTSSLIRGYLYPPAESCMTMMAPPSPSSAITPTFDHQNTSDGTAKPGSANSGVKTFIGSIRRALHSRNGTQYVSRAPGISGPSLRGKTSAVPTNVAFGSESYRDRKLAALSRKPLRIDVLCDTVLEQYREATGHGNENTAVPATTPRLQEDAEAGTAADTATGQLGLPEQVRAKSQATAGSESIVIVDDTGFDLPIMSGAAGEQIGSLDQPPRFLNTEDPSSPPKTGSLRVPSQKSSHEADEYSLPIFYDGVSSRPRRPSGAVDNSDSHAQRSSLSGNRSVALRMRRPLSFGLRKYASFQSGMSRYRASMGSESVPSRADLKSPHLNVEKPTGPTGPILRRRPGGDLRKMRNGGSFETQDDPETFLSDRSYRSSMPESVVSGSEIRQPRPETSLIPPNPRLSDMRPHSPHNARRSFEAAIAQFAQIPDDDDGGIESTLLKLEGKWQGPSPDSDDNATQPTEQPYDISESNRQREEQKWRHHHQHIVGQSSALAERRHQPLLDASFAYSQVRGRLAPPRPYSDSIAESEESYNSIPLLERGLSDESMKKPQLSRVVSTPAAGYSKLSEISSRGTSDLESSHLSFDVVKETESLRGIPRGSTLPISAPRTSTQMADRLSGLSSDMSVDVIDRHEAIEEHQSLTSLDESSFGIPSHPLAHPPSPPITVQNHRSLVSCATPQNLVMPQVQPLTPDPSPRNKQERAHIRSIDMQDISNDVLSRSETGRRTQGLQTDPDVDHVPFVLSCESKVLAEQMTLLEMAALSEVDWRDLVEMRLSTSAPSTLSWVEFLSEEERRGIDLVVGRFNLMAKWVLSEIVLTQDIHDRARTITKFIHTATHSKKMNNYATMVQIIIALSSTDCTKLERTWALVPQEESYLFKDMESLIQPVRNFHDLRVEMETANLQEGCVPFVGRFAPGKFL